MLNSRPKIKSDESGESFLIRLSYENGYTVRQLIDIYYQNNNQIASFPSLRSINLNNANTSSISRLNFFKELALISNNNQNDILKSLVYRSENIFSKSSTTLLCKSVEVPAVLYGNDTVPICPLCLSEQEYIRQIWHIKPYLICHKHKVLLVNNCPSCCESISYLRNESILHCSCGFNLSDMECPIINSGSFSLELSNLIYEAVVNDNSDFLCNKEILPSSNIHAIFGMIIFFDYFVSGNSKDKDDVGKMSDGFIRFIKCWPHSFHDHLDFLCSKNIKCLLKPVNKSGFNKVFGELLCEVQNIPDNTFQNNIVLKETYFFLQKKIEEERKTNPRRKLASLLLTKQEAALLLGTDTNQVSKLTAEGYLTVAQKRLEAYVPIYPLGEVFGLWVTHYQNKNSNMFYYLSRI